MFSFAADLSNFHSVCVAKERALAEAQRRVKEAEREVHKTDVSGAVDGRERGEGRLLLGKRLRVRLRHTHTHTHTAGDRGPGACGQPVHQGGRRDRQDARHADGEPRGRQGTTCGMTKGRGWGLLLLLARPPALPPSLTSPQHTYTPHR